MADPVWIKTGRHRYQLRAAYAEHEHQYEVALWHYARSLRA